MQDTNLSLSLLNEQGNTITQEDFSELATILFNQFSYDLVAPFPPIGVITPFDYWQPEPLFMHINVINQRITRLRGVTPSQPQTYPVNEVPSGMPMNKASYGTNEGGVSVVTFPNVVAESYDQLVDQLGELHEFLKIGLINQYSLLRGSNDLQPLTTPDLPPTATLEIEPDGSTTTEEHVVVDDSTPTPTSETAPQPELELRALVAV